MRLTNLTLLRAVVARSGLTHRELATQAGVSHGTVGNLLAGRRTGCSAGVLAALEVVLGPAVRDAFQPRRQVAA